MKTYSRFAFFAALLIPVVLVCWSLRTPISAQEKAADGKIKWEYRVVVPDGYEKEMQTQLDQLGGEGWELCGTISNVSGTSSSRNGSGTGSVRTNVTLILKRPKT